MNQSLKHFPKLSLATSERVSLAEICSENNSRNKAGLATEIRSVTNNRGLVVTSEYFENSRTSADTTNYKVVKKTCLHTIHQESISDQLLGIKKIMTLQ
jgi:hypothetical protein